MNTRFFLLFATLGSLLLAPWAHAQNQIKGDVRNVLDHRRAGGFANVASVANAGGVVTAITVQGGGFGYGTTPPVVTVRHCQCHSLRLSGNT